MISTDYSEEEVAALDGRRSEGACATYGYPEFEQPMKNKRADPLRSKDIREISQGRPARRATLDENIRGVACLAMCKVPDERVVVQFDVHRRSRGASKRLS
jgi:hypothetical protein